MYKVCSDIIIIPEDYGRWVIINIFTRTSLGIESDSLDILQYISTGARNSPNKKYINKIINVWNITFFSNYDGLLSDPTRYKRDVNDWGEPEQVGYEELILLFKDNFFLIENEKEYLSRFSQKTSLLDTFHFGNFHEQLGQYLTLLKRASPNQWWLNQKFKNNYKELQNNLYKAIQEKFLADYFRKKFSIDDMILDIGCGVGFYSNKIAETGAKVLGVDPNDNFITIAKKNASKNASYQKMEIGSRGALDSIKSNSFDYIFMSDVLLFYFVPISSEQPDIKILLKDIFRILKPNGTFISLEPHYIFWLAPWLGDIDRPYTVITEYRSRTFYVTPSISEFIQTIIKNNFYLSWMDEIYPETSAIGSNQRAYKFASEFPLWQLFEFKKISSI